MRFLFDQNISKKIKKFLFNDYSESISTKNEGLINAPDIGICEFAKTIKDILVTHDSGFNDLYGISVEKTILVYKSKIFAY